MIRKFEVEGFGTGEHDIEIVWCFGTNCDACSVRYQCLTEGKDFAFRVQKSHWWYNFNNQTASLLQAYHTDGGCIGLNICNLVEYFLFGEKGVKNIPTDKWSMGWVSQAHGWCNHQHRCKDCPDIIRCQGKEEKVVTGSLTIHHMGR